MNTAKKPAITMILLISLLLFLSAFIGLGAVNLEIGAAFIDWSIIGGGGSQVKSAPYTLDSTVGQAVTGLAEKSNSELCAGFWCGADITYDLYLTILYRD